MIELFKFPDYCIKAGLKFGHGASGLAASRFFLGKYLLAGALREAGEIE